MRAHLHARLCKEWIGGKEIHAPRVRVVGREARRVRRVCDAAVDDLLERVDALALGIEGVHEMHSVGFAPVSELQFAGWCSAVSILLSRRLLFSLPPSLSKSRGVCQGERIAHLLCEDVSECVRW